jgi:oxygen-independent coproporphyrinogen-3 oxidase
MAEAVLQFDNMMKNMTGSDKSPYVVDTIYIGGGTPSLINGRDMTALLEGIRQNWLLTDCAEITMESNPNSLTAENLLAYRKAGINRLSIGVQSFDDKILAEIGRLHNSKGAVAAVCMAKDAGYENINLDLMFGLPGQTFQQWQETLNVAVSLAPTHLSLYTLQIEEGTKLYQDYKSDKLPLVDLEVDRACYHYAIEFLKRYGYNQYEISNFAKDGYTCKHNVKYWSMDDFLGLGLNASSYLCGKRWRNLSGLDQWTAQIENGQLPIDPISQQQETQKDAMGTFLFTGLRKTAGISFYEFKDRFGADFFQSYPAILKQLKHYRNLGQLDWSDAKTGSLWITEAGIDHSNEIMSEFV